MPAPTIRIGVDVGGTFTDFVVADQATGAQTIHKTLSTPKDPSVGVLAGLREVAAGRSLTLPAFLGQVRLIVHGTTVATNAVLTGNGARTGLLTTAGFRDVLAMRRGVRSQRNLYDNTYTAPPPLVPRFLRRPVRERMDVDGRVMVKLDEQDVARAADLFGREGVEAVAICFMHSYANPAHEQQAKQIVEQLLPHVVVCASADVIPQIRLYERVSTTVMNACVGPIVRQYLRALTRELGKAGFIGQLLIMQSNGGVATPEAVMALPVTTVLSGPAAGPTAALSYARSAGYDGCILVDAGGTSFDASLIRDGEVQVAVGGELNRHHISVPMIEINAIGAGGGSIAWLDDSGLLHVGPASAGADPGPAAYGRGGTEPTVTDAALVLGYLNPGNFLGGAMPLRTDLAEKAIATRIAGPLGLSVVDAAAGIYELVNVSMASGAKDASIRRGADPRDLPLVIAGGAGAVHAGMVAAELGSAVLLIPRAASVLCALGMLVADLRHDFVQSVGGLLAEADLSSLRELARTLAGRGRALLDNEGVDAERQQFRVAMDMRYRGQHHEVTVGLRDGGLLGDDVLARAAEAFHARHEALYGFARRDAGVEVISLRVTALGLSRGITREESVVPPGGALARPGGARPVYVRSLGTCVDVATYDGESLAVGERVAGPAVVELATTAVVVPEGFDLHAANPSLFVMRNSATRKDNTA